MSQAHSPQRIAQSFVKQYYDILAKKPEELHRFYASVSTFTHAEDPREEVELVQTGVDAIKKRVSELNYLNAHVDLSEGFLDVQRSISSADSILVVVTGHFSLREIKSRPFTHSFVLAVPTSSDTGKPGSYYVHNSVFRLISERSMPTASKAVEASPETADATTSSGSNDSSSSEQKNSKSSEASKVTTAAPEKDAKAEADAAAEMAKQESSAKDAAAAANASAAAAVAAANTGPKSYADMAKKISAVPPPAPAAAVKKSSDAEKKENNSSSKGEGKDGAKKGSSDKGPGADNHASMYVRNLTSEVTEADLRGLFASYGDVTGVDISNGKGFAFIDFGSRAAMMGVLGAKGPFTLHGNVLKVEERSSKGTTKSSSGGGGGSSGRQEKDGSGSGGGGGRRGGEGRRGGSSGGDPGHGRSGDAKKGDANGEGRKRSGGSGSGSGSSGAKKGQQGKEPKQK